MLKIGELAKQTGVSVGTLRYYESLALIVPFERSASGYRYYAETAVQTIQFIRKAQALQFSLTEIKQILVIREQGNPACATVRGLLNEKIAKVDQQIQQLDEFKIELTTYRDQWADQSVDQPDGSQICSLIEGVNIPT
jgi:DNA-binding transcriptional MerR regulator